MMLSMLLIIGAMQQFSFAGNKIIAPDPTRSNPKEIQDGFLGPDQDICRADTVLLAAPLAFNYLWSTGEGSRTIKVSPNADTDYWVTITNLQGLTQRDTVSVSVKPLPNITVSPATTQLLPGEAVLLTASGGVSYLWPTGTQGNNYFATPSLPENTYWVEGTGVNGCKMRAEANVYVNYSTNPEFEYTPVCLGDATIFEAKIQTNDTILSISWDLDGDLMFDDGTGTTQEYFYETPGERLVGIRVVTKHSITPHTKYLPVIVGDFPNVNFSFSASCAQNLIQFDDASSVFAGSIDSWQWNFGNGQTSDLENPTTTFQQPGLYTISLEVTSSIGCKETFSRQYNAETPPAIDISYQNGNSYDESVPYQMFRNDTLKLRAVGIFDSVFWNNGKENSVSYNITRGGTYSVTGYRNGCRQTKSFVVQQSEQPYDPDFKIQNILTPNGDGYNDIWEISILKNIRPAKVSVFTRAGIPVLETPSYQNDWDGSYRGNPLPEGSYFYMIEGARGEVFKGTITLLR